MRPNATKVVERIIVVTGATSGLGLAIMERLAAQPGVAIGIAPKEERLLSTKRHLIKLASLNPDARLILMQADVSRMEEVSRVITYAYGRFGRIDSVVACAGTLTQGSILEMSPSALSDALSVNVMGTYNVFRCCLHGMLQRREGRLVAIGSMEAFNHSPGFAFYSASKAALMSLTASMARELAPFGIEVICVIPGNLRTKMNPTGDVLPEISAEQIVKSHLLRSATPSREIIFWSGADGECTKPMKMPYGSCAEMANKHSLDW